MSFRIDLTLFVALGIPCFVIVDFQGNKKLFYAHSGPKNLKKKKKISLVSLPK